MEELNVPLIVLIIAVLVIILCLRPSFSEGFTKSGLSMSDIECDKLVSVYTPQIKGRECRSRFMKNVCSDMRRKQIDFPSGNFYTVDGMLL